ncbi:hypothetical protein [Metarhizobium album]|nr:hypothetical protein [Rhizobium album]
MGQVSYRDYAEAVIDYNSSLQRYGFKNAFAVSDDHPLRPTTGPGMTNSDLAVSHSRERQRGNAWAAKTIIEKADHIRLLEEILGATSNERTLAAMDAKRAKDTLLVYPRNRAKNPLTRGKPLSEVLGLPNVEEIQVATINKYLQTYNELFEWAKQNHHMDENFFLELTPKGPDLLRFEIAN